MQRKTHIKLRSEKTTGAAVSDPIVNRSLSMSYGGGYHGAQMHRRSMAGWAARLMDADAAVLPGLNALRAASSDLIRNAPIAGAAVNTNVLNVIGTGLAMNSRISAQVLGMSEVAAQKWQAQAEREFRLWAESHDCDSARNTDFYGQQRLAYRSSLEVGDVLVTTPAIDRGGPYRLAIQLTDGARVSNPGNRADTDEIAGGVEKGQYGETIAYHVASRHPGRYRAGPTGNKWQRVEAYSKNGRRNAWLLSDRRRVGQTRTPPWLSEVVEPLKQLERYTEAELMAAVVSAMFTVFIKSEPGDGFSAGLGGEDAAASGAEWDGKLGNGTAVGLAEGESVEFANPSRPNAQFEPFVVSIIKQIGAVLQIPYEVLVKSYQSSYSASKAAMLDAWRFFRERRAWMVTEFCQPIYELWLAEAVAAGRIKAPGFFTDPIRRMAYSGAEWVGDGMGTIDPLKDVQASRERVELGTSTLAAESLLHDGMGWEGKHRQRAREVAARKADGLMVEQGADTSTEESADDAMADG